MKFFNGLLSKKAHSSIRKKSIGEISTSSFLAYALGYQSGQTLTAQSALAMYSESAAVATAVDMIADEVEQITPVIVGVDNKLIDSHSILDLLKKPNPIDDRRALIGKLARHWLLCHENNIYLEGSITRIPINIWAVSPSIISPMEHNYDGFADNIQITYGPGTNNYKREDDRKKRTWRYLANDYAELCRVLGFSSKTSNIRADSPLQAAAVEVNQQIQGKLHNVKMIENGARISLVATFRDTLEGDEHMARKAKIQSELGGSGNAGKIAVIGSEDMELKELGFSNKDMDYASLEKISALAIYMRYKIPLPLISNESATYNNMEQAKFDLYDRAVLPVFNIIASMLTSALMLRAGLDPNKFRISYNPEEILALRGRMLTELKIRRDINIETPNELRSFLPGREPISSGGDILYQAATLVPVGIDQFTADNDIESAKDRISQG